MRHTAEEIQKWNVHSSKDGEHWIPARALNYTLDSFMSRLKDAWGVFTGRYDALDWQERD